MTANVRRLSAQQQVHDDRNRAPQVSPRRLAGQRPAALALHRAITGVSSLQAVADRLEVSKSLVAAWTDPESGKSISLRDVYALPPSVIVSVTQQLLASIEGADVDETRRLADLGRTVLDAVRSSPAILDLTRPDPIGSARRRDR